MRPDRGAAVVWSIALTAVLVLVASVGIGVGAIVVARQRLATVADLAALAGAQALTDPCEQARMVAQANAVALGSCRVDGADVVVEVRVPAPGAVAALLASLDGQAPMLVMNARAGRPTA